MKYKIIECHNGHKSVQFIAEKGERIFGDGIRPVLVKDGHEYVKIPNPHHKFNLYSHRIKDAINQIQYGIGDALYSNHHDSVVMFLDRRYGNAIKQKTIEGWKNTKFGYSIYGYYENKIGSDSKFNKNGDFYFSDISDPDSQLIFDDITDAYSKIDEWTSDTLNAATIYKSIKHDDVNMTAFIRNMPEVVYHMLWNYVSSSEELNESGGKYILEVCQDIRER